MCYFLTRSYLFFHPIFSSMLLKKEKYFCALQCCMKIVLQTLKSNTKQFSSALFCSIPAEYLYISYPESACMTCSGNVCRENFNYNQYTLLSGSTVFRSSLQPQSCEKQPFALRIICYLHSIVVVDMLLTVSRSSTFVDSSQGAVP